MPAAIPRPEYPRPQMIRERWLNLNGTWEFEIDQGDSGLERGLAERKLRDSITVPFSPESEASTVANTDFLGAVWYRRSVAIPPNWRGERILLHFGAVDHDATVWVNGIEVARHRGGFTPFSADITDALVGPERSQPGGSWAATIVVRARDPQDQPQARGKQARTYANTGCFYTRTTGIWQTVWLEPVPEVHLGRPRITPHVGSGALEISVPVSANIPGTKVTLSIGANGREVTSAEAAADLDREPVVFVTLPEAERRLWSPQDPFLYDVDIALVSENGEVSDAVSSYAGLRSVTIDRHRILINGKPVFQRLVLDQGYWPQSLMTAPSDDALVRDIELSMAAGFNGARLHQRVAEERFLYHADRLGYLVWGEFGDWGVVEDGPPESQQHPTASFITQWLEALVRDYSHPSIIGWCPLNETRERIGDRISQLDDVTAGMYWATKAADRTRPVLDASGYSHRVRGADVYDSHSYEQDPARFAQEMSGLASGKPFVNSGDGGQWSLPYEGQPYFVSEFGGIWWNEDAARADASGNEQDASWGYGERVGSAQEFYERFAGLTDVLLDDANMFGYCYTQLADTFQEQNGIYGFDRSEKFDMEKIRAVQERTAAYEKEQFAADTSIEKRSINQTGRQEL